MSIGKLLKAIAIIRKYDPNGESPISFSQIFFGNYWDDDGNEIIQGADKAELEKLGWFQDEDTWSCYD